MKDIIRSVKGTRDFYPDEMAKRVWLIQKLEQASRAFGYEQYEGPCLETIDLYAAKSGEELVKEQAFVFEDRGGDPISLRPELTPTLARMIASKQNELVFPLRWWAFGPFWRYERPQKGRTREFYQWNIDLIGSDSVQADAELMAVAATFLKLVGLKSEDVKLFVNDRRLMDRKLTEIGINGALKPDMLRMIDRIDKQPADVWDKNVSELGLNAAQITQIKALLSNMELWKESAELSQLFAALDSLGVAEYVSYDPKIIRGLDYYTGTVFEAHETKGNFRAILGGGHYANLVADVGGKPLPGVGFAMGDVVIMLVLEAFGLLPTELTHTDSIFVTVFNEEMLTESTKLAGELRAAGLNVIMTEPDKLGKQFKYADRLGLKTALVLGPDELVENTVVVKNLKTFEQIKVPRADLLDHLV
ncbi:MAG TPA: histidine--tRNA ligase [Chloroflexi bacterium]|jgi:histidyl-tRNA synthetase|nr:histidine--tRNA ligase [Chloroflexota bacterium]